MTTCPHHSVMWGDPGCVLFPNGAETEKELRLDFGGLHGSVRLWPSPSHRSTGCELGWGLL